jgi:hypothetical protein
MALSPEERAYQWLARTAYLAYGNATGWLNYQGLPMPAAWEDLPETIQAAWIVVADVLVPEVEVPEAGQDAAPGDTYEPGA